MRRRVKCPICHKPPEVASLVYYAYAHWCTDVGKPMFSNGILWSTHKEELVLVSRR